MLDEKKPRMPHFAPLLDEAQTEAIVDYLRAAPDGGPR
jgi:mono/diheme cytochrome c family protein